MVVSIENKIEKEKPQKLNVWISKHQKDFLSSKAIVQGKSVSVLIRECINMYENVETLNTSIDKVCEIIDMQIDRSFKKNLDRLIKLVVKAVLSAEASNHNSAVLVANVLEKDLDEVNETAYHYAIEYLKKRGGDNV